MPGRAGRGCFDRDRYGPAPKYLSLKPPPLRFSCPNLKNNPFYLLSTSKGNKENFISIPFASSASSLSDTSKGGPLPSSPFNCKKTFNDKSTESYVKNPQDQQGHKNSSRDDFIRFYARQKKSKFGKYKKIQNKLRDSSHSLRAHQANQSSIVISTISAMSASAVTTASLPPAIKQSFLHALVRKTLFLSKLRPSESDDMMITNPIDLPVPPESEMIEPYPNLTSVVKSLLHAFYVSCNHSDKLETLHSLDNEALLLEAYKADNSLRAVQSPGPADEDMSDATSTPTPDETMTDNTSGDVSSDDKGPAPPDVQNQANETSTQRNNSSYTGYRNHDKNESTNVGMFTSKITPPKQDNPNEHPAPGADQNSNNKRKQLDKTTITCRFRIKIQQNMCNVPFLARQVAHQIRKADNAMSILPFHDNPSDNRVLDNEALLPDNEEEVKIWVANAYTYRDNVNFSMKFSVLKTFKTITSALFPWMSKNNSFVKMDKIKSEKIVTVGFFTKLHPDYHNRDDFKIYCKKHVLQQASSSLSDDISVYARSVYAGAGLHKVTSRVCVIECAVEDADLISEAFSVELGDHYMDVTFLPFVKQDDTYCPMLRAALIEQNLYLQNTKRLFVKGLTNLNKYVATVDCDGVTPRSWLLKVKYEDQCIIQAVERNNDYAANILYHKEKEKAIL